MEKTVLKQIDELNRMSMAELRQRWVDLMGPAPAPGSGPGSGPGTAPGSRSKPGPGRLGRQYLIRRLAYRIQELAYGGLSKEAVKHLEAVADGRPAKAVKGRKRQGPILTTGTRLLREWHGDRYEVIVEADGFRYDGKLYRSLSAVAKAITGSHMSGHLFFGLKRDDKRGGQ